MTLDGCMGYSIGGNDGTSVWVYDSIIFFEFLRHFAFGWQSFCKIIYVPSPFVLFVRGI